VETPAILQTFLVRNDAPSRLPRGELSLRYYYTNDGATDERPHCDESRAVPEDACVGVMTSLFGVSPGGPFVNGYVELRFPDGDLAAGAQTGETPITIDASGDERYEQASDYSFAENESFAVNAKVTLYRRGVLIWGTEPPGTTGSTTSVR
jgi:cellulose 1,4-beta-cellobiosidase